MESNHLPRVTDDRMLVTAFTRYMLLKTRALSVELHFPIEQLGVGLEPTFSE